MKIIYEANSQASIDGYSSRVVDIVNTLEDNPEVEKFVRDAKITLDDMRDPNKRDKVVQYIVAKFTNRKGRIACYTYASVTYVVLKLLGESPTVEVGLDTDHEFLDDQFCNHVWTRVGNTYYDYPENRYDGAIYNPKTYLQL